MSRYACSYWYLVCPFVFVLLGMTCLGVSCVIDNMIK